MKYRILGKTGLKVSEIGFGCWEIGGGKWDSSDEKARESLMRAADMGVNFFDTAFSYGKGHSEMLVGELAKEHEIIVATKIPPKSKLFPFVDRNDIENVFPEKHILEFAKKSYENLGKKTIDILQLHLWRDNWTEETCWMEAFGKIRDEGIANHFGVSVNNHEPNSAVKLVKSGKIESVQVIYNIFDQSPEDELFEACKKNNVGVIARCPFDEGSLAGFLSEKTKFSDWRERYFTQDRLKEVVKRVEALRWLENKNRTLTQAALQFCLHHKAVSTVIPGSTSSKHAEENAKACEEELTAEELKKLKSHRWIRNFYAK